MINILLGDVGGTKIRLELCKYDPMTDTKVLTKKENYKTPEYKSLAEVLTVFFTSIEKGDYPTEACIAMCGPVLNNNIIKMHNTRWINVNGDELALQFSINNFLLINDFQAVGFAHKTFNESNLVQLNRNADMNQKGTLMLIGFGTGMGVSCVNEYNDYSGNPRTKVLSSEASSTPLGIKNKFDFLYQQFIRKQYKLAVNRAASIELLIGTRSVPYMYEFFRLIHQHQSGFKFENKDSHPLDAEVFKINIGKLQVNEPKDIIEKFKEGDVIAIHTIKYFLELLGNAIFTLCVAYLPTGGVILMGQFLLELYNSFGDQKNQYTDLLTHNFLLDSFLRERFSNAKISLYMHKHEPELQGALNYIKKKIVKPNKVKLNNE